MRDFPAVWRWLSLLWLAAATAWAPAAGALDGEAAELVGRGDAAWTRRAEGHRGPRAAAAPVDGAIAAYEQALRLQPANPEISWKLLRALHFKGDFVVSGSAAQQQVFDRGRQVAEAAIGGLARPAGGRPRFDALAPAAAAKALAGVPDAAPVFLWAGVHWGLWGDAFGRLAAARQGVGDKVRRYGEIGVLLDERRDDAAGHRLLGRLHALAPKVPFVTGWVDRDVAIAELRKAVALAPANANNQLYLAEALLEHKPAAKAEAQAILRRLAARSPDPAQVVEEEHAIAAAKRLLASAR